MSLQYATIQILVRSGYATRIKPILDRKVVKRENRIGQMVLYMVLTGQRLPAAEQEIQRRCYNANDPTALATYLNNLQGLDDIPAAQQFCTDCLTGPLAPKTDLWIKRTYRILNDWSQEPIVNEARKKWYARLMAGEFDQCRAGKDLHEEMAFRQRQEQVDDVYRALTE